jgi:hypothetical protein
LCEPAGPLCLAVPAIDSISSSKSAPVKGSVSYAVAIAALGGLFFGYDNRLLSGAILFVKAQFHLSSTMEKIVVSAAHVDAICGGPLAAR